MRTAPRYCPFPEKTVSGMAASAIKSHSLEVEHTASMVAELRASGKLPRGPLSRNQIKTATRRAGTMRRDA